MNMAKMALCGWGIYSDQFLNAAALAASVHQAMNKSGATGNDLSSSAELAPAPDPELESALHGMDEVSQYAFRALHEALQGARQSSGSISLDRTALVLLSNWGPMDNTVSFLDSMLDADGRYASPRHFTRSVYSTVASHAAIYFGIHGPCETLAHGQWPMCGVLDRAADLLASGRVDCVIACWADQASSIAKDLCRRSVQGLKRREFVRFTLAAAGYGAVAVVLRRSADASPADMLMEVPNQTVAPAAAANAPVPQFQIHSFPTDQAVHLAVAIVTAEAAVDQSPIQCVETNARQGTRIVRIMPRPRPSA